MRNNLKSARLSKGLTQKELAAQIGISERHYSNIEKGDTRGVTSMWMKLSKILDVSVPYLMESVEVEGKKLRRLRQEKGLSQKKVATYCGIGKETYRAIENGFSRSSPETWKKLSEFFGTPVDYESNKEGS